MKMLHGPARVTDEDVRRAAAVYWENPGAAEQPFVVALQRVLEDFVSRHTSAGHRSGDPDA